MPLHRPLTTLAVVVAALIFFPASASAEPNADEILQRADAILAPAEFEARVELVTHRDGEGRRFEMHVWKKGLGKSRIRFLAPAADRDSEVLRDGDNMWHFLPNLKRSIRISPRQEFHGGDFNNADLLRTNLAVDYAPTLARSESSDTWLLELKAKHDTAAYDFIRYWVRKADNMPLRQEFYTRSGKMIRALELSEPKSFGGHERPTRLLMKNVLVPSRSSEMVIKKFVVKQKIDEGLFQLSALGR